MPHSLLKLESSRGNGSVIKAEGLPHLNLDGSGVGNLVGVYVNFGVGDEIAVIAGVWKDTAGVVQRMDFGKQTATINVDLFGRETPVEISFAEVRKIDS